jgi:hypothetical protein
VCTLGVLLWNELSTWEPLPLAFFSLVERCLQNSFGLRLSRKDSMSRKMQAKE